MHVHVVGVGAVGTLVAAHVCTSLRQAHARAAGAGARGALATAWDAASTVTLHLREMRHRRRAGRHPVGKELTVERDGVCQTVSNFRVEWASALDAAQPRVSPPHEPLSPMDSVIVTTKADATCAALRPLAPRITPSTTVVLLQNGMGVLDVLLEQLWRDPSSRPHFVLASTTHGCFLKRPLHTVHAGFGAIHMGIVPNARYDANLERRRAPHAHAPPLELDSSDLPTTPSTASLRSTLSLLLSLPLDVHWEPIRAFQLRALRKLIINACINPITALVDCKNGELFGAPPALDLFRALCTEASQVIEAHARDAQSAQGTSETDAAHLSSLPLADLLTQTDADGLPLLDASLMPSSMLHEVENVVRATAANWSSMHQDVQSRRGRTEIDFINGYLSELGRAYGIPTPANDFITNLVKLKTQRATGSWRGRGM